MTIFATDNQEVDFFSMNLLTERVIMFDRSWSNDVVMSYEDLEDGGKRYKITNNGTENAAIDPSINHSRVILKPNYSIYFNAPNVREYGWNFDSSIYKLKGDGSRF